MKRLLILSALLICAAGTNVFAQMSPMPHVIAVSGEAEEQVAPDQATLSISLVNKNMDLAKAKQENDAMVERVVVIARDFKIPRSKIATSSLYISPEYNYDSNARKPQFMGYTVNRSLRITMDELEIHERVLSALVDAKVDQVGGVEFGLADREAHMEKVRIKAMENARAKAQTLAKAANVKLGPVINISTTGMPLMPPPMPMMRAMSADMMEKSVAPSLPGMVTLHETVQVTFGLE
jgi:uncharacterized protein